MAHLDLKNRVLEARIGYVGLPEDMRAHFHALASDPKLAPTAGDNAALVVVPPSAPKISGCEVRFTLLEARAEEAPKLDLDSLVFFGDPPFGLSVPAVAGTTDARATLEAAVERAVERMKQPRARPAKSEPPRITTQKPPPQTTTQRPPPPLTEPPSIDPEVMTLRRDLARVREDLDAALAILERLRHALAQ